MSYFKYDELVQEALISVVKKVLSDVVVNGLVGNHHFYIRFRTDHPKTKVPRFLKERHPEEVMIVLQHQFWNLSVKRDGVSVDLSFDNIRETLFIPFNALTAFVDPSVKFALQFTPKFVEDEPAFPDDDNKPKASVHIEGESNIIRFDNFKKR